MSLTFPPIKGMTLTVFNNYWDLGNPVIVRYQCDCGTVVASTVALTLIAVTNHMSGKHELVICAENHAQACYRSEPVDGGEYAR